MIKSRLGGPFSLSTTLDSSNLNYLLCSLGTPQSTVIIQRHLICFKPQYLFPIIESIKKMITHLYRIHELVKSCVYLFGRFEDDLETRDYPQPSRSAFLKMTNSLGMATGAEPKVSVSMVSETMARFEHWALGGVSSSRFDYLDVENQFKNMENATQDFIIKQLKILVDDLDTGTA